MVNYVLPNAISPDGRLSVGDHPDTQRGRTQAGGNALNMFWHPRHKMMQVFPHPHQHDHKESCVRL